MHPTPKEFHASHISSKDSRSSTHQYNFFTKRIDITLTTGNSKETKCTTIHVSRRRGIASRNLPQGFLKVLSSLALKKMEGLVYIATGELLRESY